MEPPIIKKGNKGTNCRGVVALMIEQDYAELLSRTPPSGDTLEWTFSTRLFAIAFPSFLVGTPALCLILFVTGVSGEDHDPRHGGTNFRVPTLTRIGEDNTIGQIFTAGIHLAAVCALPLFWCVRLAHHQRLQARTGIARYDLEADGARRWVEGAWILGAFGSVFLFVAFSVTGDEEESFSKQGIAHFVIVVAAELGMLGQAVCTVCAIRKARRVFIVSDADWASYRRKLWLSVAMILSCVAAVASVILLEFLVDGTDPVAMGGILAVETNQSAASAPEAAILIGSDDKEALPSSGLMGLFTENCDSEWCYSRSTLALWEWVFILLEAGFCLTLRNDLTLATGGVGVEGFVL